VSTLHVVTLTSICISDKKQYFKEAREEQVASMQAEAYLNRHLENLRSCEV